MGDGRNETAGNTHRQNAPSLHIFVTVATALHSFAAALPGVGPLHLTNVIAGLVSPERLLQRCERVALRGSLASNPFPSSYSKSSA